MNLHRLFPLLVVLSRDQIQKPLERAIEQAHIRGLRVGQGLPVEVEPVLPGCLCFPHHRLIAPDDDVGLARFHVLPQLSGKVTDACVVLRQGSEILGEVPLQMTVRRQWLVILLGVMTPVVPFLVRLFHLDPTEHVDEHFGSVYGLLTWLLVQLQSASWWAALLAMAAITGLTWWWWVRPRREEFYDVELLPPVAERLTRARQLLRAGQEDEGLAEIDLLRQERPDSREGSILLGMWYLENMQYRTAYEHFQKGLDGPTPTKVCQLAARAAVDAGEPNQALAWLEKGLRSDTPAAVRAQIRHEQARIVCGRGDREAAMKYLLDIKEGAQSRSAYETDLALASLHNRPDFQEFLKRLPV
jgi:hypothetical protein